MKRLFRAVAGSVLGLCLLAAPLHAQGPRAAGTGPTALDRYVAKKEAVYGWKFVKTIPGQGYKTHVLELTSQTWRGSNEVDRPVWKHWMTLVVPDKVVSDKAFLYIDGGDNDDPAPNAPPSRGVKLATDTGTVAIEVRMVPNQPLVFADSPTRRRGEDDLIAYSRVKHAATKDDEWLVRLAMVKSGVKALDAAQEFMRSDAGGRIRLREFVVSGGSKRGWTAWLVAAADPRVIGVIPLVIDALNSEEVTKHGFEAYGAFSSSLGDYVNHGLFPHKIGTPEYQAVLAIEDPYQYRLRPRMRMPKFIINSAGDQFFVPDNSQFYYKDLVEEKRLRYVPNTRHNLGASDAQDSMVAFYQAVITGKPRPRYSWTKAADGTLTVRPIDRPKEVNLWQATNPNARDFRKDVICNAYVRTPMRPGPDGTYTVRAPDPPSGYTAFFVELVYDIGLKYPLKFTSEVSVVPTAMPYKWADAAAKYAPGVTPVYARAAPQDPPCP
jgi:PhoPQ-activated pathogenicity-related protein